MTQYVLSWTRDEPAPTDIFDMREQANEYIKKEFKYNTIETRFGWLTTDLDDNFAFLIIPKHD